MTRSELTILVDSLLTRMTSLEDRLSYIMYGMGFYRTPHYPPYPNTTPSYQPPLPWIITCNAGGSK